MKKLFLLLTILLLTSVFGCGNSDVEKYNKEHSQPENQKQDIPQQNADQGITVNKISYAILKYEDLPADLQAMANLEPTEEFTRLCLVKVIINMFL